MNRKKLILLISVLLLALAITWSYMSMPRFKTVAPGSTAAVSKRAPTPVKGDATRTAKTAAPAPMASQAAAGAATAPALNQVAVDERVLRLDLLENNSSRFKGYRRNIFKPVFADEVKLLKQKAAAVKPVPVPPMAVAPPPVAVAPVQPPVAPPDPKEILKSTLGQFTYLGFLKKDNRKTIFLSKDKEIILVRKGERFAKRYEATNITEQALTIKVTETGEEIVIPLTENKSLAAALK